MALVKPSDILIYGAVVRKGTSTQQVTYEYDYSISSNLHVYSNLQYSLWYEGYQVVTQGFNYPYNFDPHGGVLYVECPQSDKPESVTISGYTVSEEQLSDVLWRSNSCSIKLSSDAVDVTTLEDVFFEGAFVKNIQLLKQASISISSLKIPEKDVNLVSSIANLPIALYIMFAFPQPGNFLRISGYFVITDYTIDSAVDNVAEVSLDLSALSSIGVLLQT